ncbi:hypothetical protein RvY_08101 [Ramazzottius varieornatus]|uniref:LisH domain-containing protein n=1 Tax=Ramazzottius varieornatus TaxID=947166 RepID=A0A1D1VCU2_RAMVA|nr:hypothetical protein RvY_08101 [Ramazzottius varieornatus]
MSSLKSHLSYIRRKIMRRAFSKMDEYLDDVTQASRALSNGLKTGETSPETEEALYRLAILTEEAFEELLSHPDSALYDVCTLYSKVRNTDESRKIRALCRVLVYRVDIFREALESLIRSPFWELFIETPTLSESSQYENRTSKTLSYCAAAVLYAVVFAFNRLVECPDDMWYSTEDQYLPIICFLAAPASGNTTSEIRALLSGTYALYSTLVFDAARHSCPVEVADTVVEHHLTNIERYLDTNTTEKTDVEADDNGEPEVVTGSSAANFALFPMSETLQARMFAEFLSSFGKHPHVQNDSIKKALQNNMYRVLEIGSRTLAHHASLDPHIVACLVKLVANMIHAYPAFASQFVTDSGNLDNLLSIPIDSRAGAHVASCVNELLTVRFWSTGDPVGGSQILTNYIQTLDAIATVPPTLRAIDHLRAGGAVEIFESSLWDMRHEKFDPLRTKGKEVAVQYCIVLIHQSRVLICNIFTMMLQSPLCRNLLVNSALFRSTRILGNLMLKGRLIPEAEVLLRKLYDVHADNVDMLAYLDLLTFQKEADLFPAQETLTLDRRLLHYSLGILENEEAYRRKGCREVFAKTRKVALIQMPLNTGVCKSTTFLGEKQDKIILRASTGHLICVKTDDLSVMFSHHDWVSIDETDIMTLLYNPNTFLTTSTGLVTRTRTNKSHLWMYEEESERCRRLVEFKNFQFLRPSNIYPEIAVGHAAIWKKKHGYYFTLDMETSQKVTMLGPTKEEETHPNLPSFHPNAEMVMSMGCVWDYRNGSLIHRFDRVGRRANMVENIMHSNSVHVIIDDQLWDLRNYKLLHRFERLRNSGLQFNSTGDILIGKSASANCDDLIIYDSYDYSKVFEVPFNGTINSISLDTWDRKMVVSRNEGFPVFLEIGSSPEDERNYHPDFID